MRSEVAETLKGKKVAILAADMFERVELEKPRKALEDAGADVEVVSIHDGEIKGFDHFDPATTVKVDRTVEEASPDDYDALMIPGGVGNPDQLRGDENVISFVREFHRARKPMASSATARSASRPEQNAKRGRNAAPLSLEVADGTRTRGHRDHNPELYQLSYRHRARTA
jgi:hypothetical protein